MMLNSLVLVVKCHGAEIKKIVIYKSWCLVNHTIFGQIELDS